MREVRQVYFDSSKGRYLVRFADGSNSTVGRLLGAIKAGRPLGPDEVAHHINGNRTDDRLANIAVVTQGDHLRLHHAELNEFRFPADRPCPGCGCPAYERTEGCNPCSGRHNYRRRHGKGPYVPPANPHKATRTKVVA